MITASLDTADQVSAPIHVADDRKLVVQIKEGVTDPVSDLDATIYVQAILTDGAMDPATPSDGDAGWTTCHTFTCGSTPILEDTTVGSGWYRLLAGVFTTGQADIILTTAVV